MLLQLGRLTQKSIKFIVRPEHREMAIDKTLLAVSMANVYLKFTRKH